MKKIALTGDRPTGHLHLGHYVGSLLNRIEIQKSFQQYIMIADLQALTDNFANPEKVTRNAFEIVKDYLAVGISASDSTIFLQSQIKELTELTFYYMNLVNLGRLERNPTVKNEIQQKNYSNEIPVGFLCYPISQAADITLFRARIIPVGNDQLPMIEQTNEIVRKFNRIYETDFLVECEPYLNSKSQRLVGIDGNAKASKSLGNAIFLSDSNDEIKRKVFLMYTDPNHIKVSDPGTVEGNVVFEYLTIFHEDQDEVESMKDHYRKGGLGDSSIKNILTKKLTDIITPIRDKRSLISLELARNIVFDGTKKTSKVATENMAKIKEIMKIDYGF